MAKKVLSKVPKATGYYCVKSKPASVGVRCVHRYSNGKVSYKKNGNIQCQCPTTKTKKRSKKSKNR